MGGGLRRWGDRLGQLGAQRFVDDSGGGNEGLEVGVELFLFWWEVVVGGEFEENGEVFVEGVAQFLVSVDLGVLEGVHEGWDELADELGGVCGGYKVEEVDFELDPVLG